MMRCLYCGRTLAGDGLNFQWHAGCAKKFFGSAMVPAVSIDSRDLEEYARRNVEAGNTVTGVQKKMSLHLSQEGSSYRLTLVGYPAGFILKPPSIDYPELPELEQTVMSLADAAGLKTVPHSLLLLADGERAYITRRIDRTDSTKLGMEDLCQLSGRLTEDKYKGSYEQCGKVILRYSDRPGLDITEYFYLLLFSFITGNSDMHLKNFSLLKSSVGWVLAPAYDLVATTMLIPEDTEETALSVNGKKARLGRGDFTACGTTLGISLKVIDRLMYKLQDAASGFQKSIENSFLEEESRHALVRLIEERLDRLST